MRIILTVAGLSPEFGGPSHSIPALAEALAREGVNVDLLTCEAQTGHSAPALPDAGLVRTSLLAVRSRRGRWRSRRNDFFRTLCNVASDTGTVIHDNGIWLPTNHAVATAARFLERPRLISPRGMLSTWASAHHGWKKKIGWMLFQRRDLLSASALHVTSQHELADARRVGFRGPIAVVPNGIDVPEQRAGSRERGARRTESKEERGDERVALCVTRIHPVKGLMNLVEAWSAVQPKGWRMVIAGSDENGHRAELEAAIAGRALGEAFEFVGPIKGEHKQTLYETADLFVLPSYSENFGMAIAEALANELPVITTQGTPWKDLVDNGCGWWEEIGARPLARALRKATQLNDETRRKMGERGRELVATKYSWPRIAKEMKSVYEWLAGQGERPNNVATTEKGKSNCLANE